MFSVPVFRFKPQYPLGCWGTWGYSPVPAQVFSHTTPHHTTCLFPMSKQAFFWSKGHLFSQVGCYPKYARNYIWQNLSSYMISFHWFSNSSTEIRVNTKLWIFFPLFPYSLSVEMFLGTGFLIMQVSVVLFLPLVAGASWGGDASPWALLTQSTNTRCSLNIFLQYYF